MTEKAANKPIISIGDRVKLLQSIWDDGEDHQPPRFLASMGQEVVVKAVDADLSLAVAHEDVTDHQCFAIYKDEYKLVSQ